MKARESSLLPEKIYVSMNWLKTLHFAGFDNAHMRAGTGPIEALQTSSAVDPLLGKQKGGGS